MDAYGMSIDDVVQAVIMAMKKKEKRGGR